MPKVRQLAAIMFTDIVGFTALMGSDEQKTFEILEKNRQIHKPVISEYNGQWIKELGDGVMATFPTVSDAVNAAIKIQEACNAAKDYQLRIGIHSAEVVFEDGDVFGNGVNIASRIESLGVPGAILVSRPVRNQLTNKSEFQLSSLGNFDFKNVSEPMEVFALSNPGFVVPKPEELKGKLKQVEKKSSALKWLAAAVLLSVSAFAIWFFNGQNKIAQPVIENSIAVLPFVNMSDDSDQEYFSDGLSEEIINILAQVPGLKIIGRTSSFAFKGKNLDLKIIGEQLNVSHILEGSVRKAGNTLRITAQLIKVADGFHLYSEKFDRELEDIFAIQDEISLSILDAVKLELLSEEKEAVLKKYTDNVEAYQLYLKGLYHFNKLTPDDFLKAIEFYQAAVDIDSEYSIAYAGLANCYQDSYYYNWLPKEQSLPQAINAADKALQLDDQNAESHIALGRIKLWIEWDFTAALNELEKGIRINPNNVEGLRQLGVWNMIMENYPEANKYLQKAETLDPFSLLNLYYIAAYHMWDGDYKKTLEFGNRLVALEPNFFGGHSATALANLGSHQYEESIANAELTVKLNSDIGNLANLGLAYGLGGEKAKAREVLKKMDNIAAGQNVGNYYFGQVYASLGEWDHAFEYFDKAVTEHEGPALYFKASVRGFFPEMYNDPRTKKLIEDIGLPSIE